MRKRFGKEVNKTKLFDYWAEKYGVDLVSDLYLIRKKPFLGITDLARKYGMTKQYISQMFEKLHGEKYEKYERIKSEDVKREVDSIGCNCDPIQLLESALLCNSNPNSSGFKQLITKNKFMEECNKRDIEYKILKDNRTFFFEIKKNRIFTIYSNQNNKDFHQIQVKREKGGFNRLNINYIAAYLADEDKFAIIPNKNAKSVVIYKYTDDLPLNKMLVRCAFIDRWDYLKKE